MANENDNFLVPPEDLPDGPWMVKADSDKTILELIGYEIVLLTLGFNDWCIATFLCASLNELFHHREERRWRVIREGELPKPGAWCQLANSFEVRGGSAQWQGSRWVDVGADESIQPDGELYENGIGLGVFLTHWRPAPTDAPTDN